MTLHHPSNRWAVTAFDAQRPASAAPIIWRDTREAAHAVARQIESAAIRLLARMHPDATPDFLAARLSERLDIRINRIPMGEE